MPSREKTKVQVSPVSAAAQLHVPDGQIAVDERYLTVQVRRSEASAFMRKLYLRAPVRARALPHGRPNAASLRLVMMKRLSEASLPRSAAAVVVGHSMQPNLTTQAAHGVVGGGSDLWLVPWRAVQQRWLQTAHAGVCRGSHATSACGRWWYVRPDLRGRKEHVLSTYRGREPRSR